MADDAIDVGGPATYTASPGGTIQIPADDPNHLSQYAGQSMGVNDPSWLPKGIVVAPGTKFPLTLNFGQLPGQEPKTVAVERAPLAPTAPSPAKLAPIADSDFVPDVQQPIADKDFVPDNPAAPSNENVYKAKILAEAKSQGLTDEQAQLAVGLAKTESGFDPNAKGKADPDTGHQAQGLFQLFPGAAQDVGADPTKLLDPDTNIKAGVGYFKQQLDKFDGNIPMAMMAYNKGANAPSQWDPNYVVQNYKNAGLPLPDNFHNLAGQLYQTQHLNADNSVAKGITDPGWNFSKSYVNNATLGAAAPIEAMATAAQQGTDYNTQYDLMRAQQQEWEDSHLFQNMTSGIGGFVLPNLAVGKAAMVGGKAALEAIPQVAQRLGPMAEAAAPYITKPISALIGAQEGASGAAPIAKQAAGFVPRLQQIPRAAAIGGGLGVVDAGANPNTPISTQAATSAIGGGALSALAAPLQVAGSVGKQILGMASHDDRPVYTAARQSLGDMLGTTSPTLGDSSIQVPSASGGVDKVQYSLPEALQAGGTPSKKINARYQKIARGTAEQQTQIEHNTNVRHRFLDQTIGAGDIPKLQADVKARGQEMGQISAAAEAAHQKRPASNIFKFSMQPSLDKLIDVRSDAKLMGPEGMDEAMDKLERKFYTRAPIAGQKPRVIASPNELLGTYRYIQDQLDKLDSGVNQKGDKVLKGVLADFKDLLGKEIDKIPGMAFKRGQFADTSQHLAEKVFLNEAHLANSQGQISPERLHTLIEKIKDSDLYQGVLGKKNQAKSVFPETLEKLQTLLDDLNVSRKAGVSVTQGLHAGGEAGSNYAEGVSHAFTKGASGVLGGYASSALGLGPFVGLAAGVIGENTIRMAAKMGKAKLDRVLLDTMLHPHDYSPLIRPEAEVPQGFYSAHLGSTMANKGLAASPTNKGKNDE